MQIFTYDFKQAIAYANTWALGRNPRYFNFAMLGGDCTNFISQCLYAGSGVMNPAKTFGWYYRSAYDRTPSWSGVPFLYNFLISNKGYGPFASKVNIEDIQLGDIIQLGDGGNRYYHSLFVTSILNYPPKPDSILVSTHDFDAYLRPLSTYDYVTARFLHIEGVRK